MERSNALAFAGSIERAAEIVTEGTAFFSPEYLAGQYAFVAADEGDGGATDRATLEAHLDFLNAAGAKFNYSEALKTALQFAAEAN